MKIDTYLAAGAPDKVAAQAREFETLGFDCAWSIETSSDPFLPLAHAAAATQRLQIGTNIAVAFARSPFSIAQTAWDLQRDSHGRFHLGLGTQVRAHIERRFSMTFEHPAARVTDYIRCVRAIWETFQTGARPQYEGPYYRFKLMNPFFNPGPIDYPHVPIYLAGVNPRMCRAAGEVADGFHVHPMHSVSYLRDVVHPALAEGARAGGRDISSLELYAPVFVVTADTQAETDRVEQLVRAQVAFYGSTPSYAGILEHHGYGDLGRKLNGLMREGKTREMAAAIPDDLLEQVAIICAPADVGRCMRERYDGVLDRVSLNMPVGGEIAFNSWRELISTIHS
ncbi:MAG: putative F420-dependent oxidoreductase [Gammaproteobacteria bacterium]|jgi:probable F420-dependent oxidoreductase